MSADESVEVPIIGSSRNMNTMTSKTSIAGNGVLNNEVIIDFRHIEDEPAEISTSVRKLSSQVNSPEKNSFILTAADQIPMVVRGKERGRGGGRRQKQQQHSADPSKERESEDHSREEYYNQKEKGIRTEPHSTTGNESEDAVRKHLPRSRASRPPQMSVATNINEKADAFIRSRKEAMSKNFGYGS